MKPRTEKEKTFNKSKTVKIYESEHAMDSPASDTLQKPRRYTKSGKCIGSVVVVVVVVVGIGRQPAPHRSEVVETPLLSDSGVYTPNMTRESSQPPNQVIETPQGALTLHVQHCTPKAHSVVHLQVKGMGRPCHRLRM